MPISYVILLKYMDLIVLDLLLRVVPMEFMYPAEVVLVLFQTILLSFLLKLLVACHFLCGFCELLRKIS